MIKKRFAKGLMCAKALLSGLAICVLATQSWANQLNDIQFSELSGSRLQLRLTFSDIPPEPTGYTIEQPARIIMDFTGVESVLPEKKYLLDIGAARSAVIVSTGDRTRLIVNLDQLPVYTSERVGNQVILEVGAKIAVSASVPKVDVHESIHLGGEEHFDEASSIRVREVDFRRGEDGEGRVIVNLTDPAVNIDVERVKGKIMLTFFNAELPQALRQRLDVTDFATPVNSITADYDGRNTVIAVDPDGSDYDYLAYQADDEYVLSVKPLDASEQQQKKEEFMFVGEKLSLNFQDIEVRSVLQLIADFTDLNMVASDTVEGRITLRLDGVPWDQALDLILKAKGLGKRQQGNVIMIAPAAEIAERELEELEALKQLEELEPLRTEYVEVRYADARELFALFTGREFSRDIAGQGQAGFAGGRGSPQQPPRSFLSPRGNAIVDERTNTIILTDTDERIARFRELIEVIDIPVRQVMIEARIVTADTNFLEEIGVRWSYAEQHSLGSGYGEATGSLDASSIVDDNVDDDTGAWTPDFDDLLLTDLAAAEGASSFAYSIIKNNFFLGLELSALEEVGKAEVVSQPKVVTGDKQEATIESGVEIPYNEATSSGAASISFREAVLRLKVVPLITPDDNIIMDLEVRKDKVSADTPGEGGRPAIDVNSLETNVLVRNGETIVLGGIFENTVIESETKVPLLGDIPYLGRLFRRNLSQDNKKELLIFITPRIMEGEAFLSK